MFLSPGSFSSITDTWMRYWGFVSKVPAGNQKFDLLETHKKRQHTSWPCDHGSRLKRMNWAHCQRCCRLQTSLPPSCHRKSCTSTGSWSPRRWSWGSHSTWTPGGNCDRSPPTPSWQDHTEDDERNTRGMDTQINTSSYCLDFSLTGCSDFIHKE